MFKRFIIAIVLNGIAIYGVTYFVPGITYQGGLTFFLIGGIIMGILNGVLKPILKLLTLPIQILTLGLSLIALNALMFWFFEITLEILLIEGVTMQITGVISYFLAGLVFGIINWLLHLFVK